jgi:hypothetical protein
MRRSDVAPVVVSPSCPHSPRFARHRRCGQCDRRGPCGRTAAAMCELLGGPDIAVRRYRAERAGEAVRASKRSSSPGAAAGVRGVDRSLRHLPTRCCKDHMLQYRNRLPSPGRGVPAQRARRGEEVKLMGFFSFPSRGASQIACLATSRTSSRKDVWRSGHNSAAPKGYATFSPAIDSFNSRAALRQNTASRSRAGRLRSSISLIARGLRDVSGGASLP